MTAPRAADSGHPAAQRPAALTGLTAAFLEDEADPADGVHHPRRAAGLELAAQLADEDVDDVGVDGEVVAPDQFEQPLPAEHDAGAAGQRLEQVELAAGEFHGRPATWPGARGGVDGERPDDEPALGAAAGTRRRSARSRATSSASANGFTR